MIYSFKKFSKKEYIIFFTISGFFFIFYLLRLFSGIFKLSDSEDYLYTSQIIKNGDYFIKNLDFKNAFFKTRRPFLYPLFLELLSSFKIEIILFVQTLFGIFNLFLIMQFQKKINLKVNNYFIILFLFNTSIFIYTNLIMTEWMVMTLIMLLSNLLISEWSKKKIFFYSINNYVTSIHKTSILSFYFYKFNLFFILFI